MAADPCLEKTGSSSIKKEVCDWSEQLRSDPSQCAAGECIAVLYVLLNTEEQSAGALLEKE